MKLYKLCKSNLKLTAKLREYILLVKKKFNDIYLDLTPKFNTFQRTNSNKVHENNVSLEWLDFHFEIIEAKVNESILLILNY